MNEKGKLLIVEDEEIIRRELECYLTAAGYQVMLIQDFSNVAADILTSTYAAECSYFLLHNRSTSGFGLR